jgi:hypothetical protein
LFPAVSAEKGTPIVLYQLLFFASAARNLYPPARHLIRAGTVGTKIPYRRYMESTAPGYIYTMNIVLKSVIFVSFILSASISSAQKTNPPVSKQPAKAVIRDTFAFNLLTTVDKVLRVAMGPKQPAMALAGELLRTDRNGSGLYRATYELPGSVETVLKLSSTNRYHNSASWSWVATMMRTPKHSDTTALRKMEARMDSILKSFAGRDLQGITITTINNLDIGYREQDLLTLEVSFSKPLHNTAENVYDSLIRLYKPLLMSKATAGECSEKFSKALELESIGSELGKKAYAGIIRNIADRDATAAYLTLLSAPYYVDMKEMIALLSDSQQSEIRSIARKALDDFYGKRNNSNTQDPVVAQKKEVEKEKPPTDPCAREVWELKIKPGAYIIANGMVSYVAEYSCSTDKYTIAWVDPTKKKLLFDRNVAVSTMDTYSQTSGSPFIVCSNCKGIGYSLEYDWYQTGVGSNFYARSNDQRKYSCGVCNGAGFIKVR